MFCPSSSEISEDDSPGVAPLNDVEEPSLNDKKGNSCKKLNE